jgi:hypothetical protein
MARKKKITSNVDAIPEAALITSTSTVVEVEEDSSSDTEKARQGLVDDSTPVDGDATEVAIKEITISDLEKSSAWAELKIHEYEDIIAHRKKWSDALLWLATFIIIMDFVVVILVGLNALSYRSPLAVPAFIGSSILEIFGLSYIVVQYLFSDSKNNKKEDKKK